MSTPVPRLLRQLVDPEFTPWLVAGVFVVLLAHASARLTWGLVAPATVAAPVEAAPQAAATDLDAELTRLRALQLFGAAAATGDAPETRLAMALRGVIATGDASSARAFIAEANGEERSYAIGATLPGGARLSAVHADRVLLERNGQFETLSLPLEVAASAASAATVSQADVRSLADGNPQRLLDVVRPVAATDSNTGRMLGYRVYPGRDADRFGRLGLMPGDLIVSVNGNSLDDPSRGLEILKGLTSTDNVMLTVERDGQQRLIQVPVSR